MKNATKYADTLHSLLRSLRREHKPEPRQDQEPLRALVRAAMSYNVSDGKADEAMRLIEKEFVGLNELRVATDLEIQELLGVRYPDIERRVAMITQALNNIFEREHTMNLERLKTISRRDARQFLRELPEIHPFVEAYVMLYGFDGHTFPMDEEILAFLKEEESLDESATLEEAQKFVEHNLKAEDMHDFFVSCRAAVSAESRRGKKKAKT
jgi:endonuclease III